MSKYLTVSDILGIHACQIAEFGGASGILDTGRLESAAARPQCGYYDGVLEEAAALWESLSQNHPFADGNKRTSFAAMVIFLDINGYDLDVLPDDAYAFVIGLYESGNFNFEELLKWLKANALPKGQSGLNPVAP